MERVYSTATSDEISRNEYQLARSRNWIHLELDYTDAYLIMEAAASDMQVAHKTVSKQLCESLARHFRDELEEIGFQLNKTHENI